MKYLTLLTSFLVTVNCTSQFAPDISNDGNIAIHKDSSVFKGWVEWCIVERGPMDISNESLGPVTAGSEEMVVGPSGESGVVSLGDGGSAICKMEVPIIDGPGYDFAVFENSFDGTFLELAFVEVSEDGLEYYRFPAISHTDTSFQIESYGTLETEKIHNLAGKYPLFYGTPFNLEDLLIDTNISFNEINYVKVIDVVGSLDSLYASYDSEGNKINDPWPTPFGPGGFDLESIGVVHSNSVASSQHLGNVASTNVYPNPVEGQEVFINSNEVIKYIEVRELSGKIIYRNGSINKSSVKFNAVQFYKGLVIVSIHLQNGSIENHKLTIL